MKRQFVFEGLGNSSAVNFDRLEIAFRFYVIYYLKPFTNRGGRGETLAIGEIGSNELCKLAHFKTKQNKTKQKPSSKPLIHKLYLEAA